jgi:hypothetical protein
MQNVADQLSCIVELMPVYCRLFTKDEHCSTHLKILVWQQPLKLILQHNWSRVKQPVGVELPGKAPTWPCQGPGKVTALTTPGWHHTRLAQRHSGHTTQHTSGFTGCEPVLGGVANNLRLLCCCCVQGGRRTGKLMRWARPACASCCCHCLAPAGTVLVTHCMASCEVVISRLHNGVCVCVRGEA